MKGKAKLSKNKKDIEIILGDGKVTKYDIMKAIAQKYTVYEATVWLNTPIEEMEGKTPAELMIQGELSSVLKLIDDSDGLAL